MLRNTDDHVIYQIGTVAHFIQNNFNQKLAEFNLTVAQAKVLFNLVNYGNQPQSDLQQRLYVKASTMNGVIETLLKKQLIEKRDNRNDRRSKLIILTQKGKELEEKLWQESENMDKHLLKGFSMEEKHLLLGWLKRIKTNVLEENEVNTSAAKVSE